MNIQEEVDFHKKRRMFMIAWSNTIILAPENCGLNHLEWLDRVCGYPTARSLIKHYVRGILFESELYFYFGEDFEEVDINTIKEFLEDLVKILNISLEAHVYSGMVQEQLYKPWKPIKDFGTIKEILKEG